MKCIYHISCFISCVFRAYAQCNIFIMPVNRRQQKVGEYLKLDM